MAADAIAESGKYAMWWDSSEHGGDCWDTLDWSPVGRSDGRLRSGYWVMVSADGTDFEVVGVADIDGDGEPCRYSVARSGEVRRHTAFSTD